MRALGPLELTAAQQIRILEKLTDAVMFEEFIQKKYVGAKSFSLEGAESLIPLLALAIEFAGRDGVTDVKRLGDYFDGIRGMEKHPAAMFVVDIKREHNAVAEARKLKIPVVAIVDTNCDPDPVDHPIPCNDDAIKAIRLITTVVADTIAEASVIPADGPSFGIAPSGRWM